MTPRPTSREINANLWPTVPMRRPGKPGSPVRPKPQRGKPR